MINLDERIDAALISLGMVASGPLPATAEGFRAQLTALTKQLIRDVIQEITPEPKDPHLVDAGNELYRREGMTPAENFRFGFTVGQSMAINSIEAKAKELGL